MPTIISSDGADTVISEDELTDRAYLHWKSIESSENLNEIYYYIHRKVMVSLREVIPLQEIHMVSYLCDIKTKFWVVLLVCIRR